MLIYDVANAFWRWKENKSIVWAVMTAKWLLAGKIDKPTSSEFSKQC